MDKQINGRLDEFFYMYEQQIFIKCKLGFRKSVDKLKLLENVSCYLDLL